MKHFKIQCAREEIQRLNIEIRWLHTAIHDEEVKVNATIDSLLISDQPVGLELRRQWRKRAAVNAIHLYRLDQITLQASFSGQLGIGVRLQCMSTSSSHGMLPIHCYLNLYSHYYTEIPSVNSTSNNQEDMEWRATALASEQNSGDILEHEEQAQVVEDFADFLVSVVD